MSARAAWWCDGPFNTSEDPAERRLRQDAGMILRAALESVDPEPLVADALHAASARTHSNTVRLLAVGKAADAMARGALYTLGDRITHGLVVRPAPPRPAAVHDRMTVVDAGHPLPDAASAFAGRAALRMARDCRPDDVLLCLLSGGGSALLAMPPDGLRLEDVRATTRALLRAGAAIHDINAVRKHTDLVKGGRLAREAACPVLVLALSDVVGDDPGVIASGPFSPDETTFTDAIDVLRRTHAWKHTPRRVRAHLAAGARGDLPDSTRPGDPCFRRIEYRVIASARTAADAALLKARSIGYRGSLLTSALQGEAREAGRRLASLGRALRRDAPCCIVAAGETTVTVRGEGAGGRNQELAVAAALTLDGQPHTLLASFATDGIDGPTDAAGAIATATTVSRAAELSIDAHAALARNDTHPFLASLGDLIRTGPTGTNAMDIQLLLVAGG